MKSWKMEKTSTRSFARRKRRHLFFYSLTWTFRELGHLEDLRWVFGNGPRFFFKAPKTEGVSVFFGIQEKPWETSMVLCSFAKKRS